MATTSEKKAEIVLPPLVLNAAGDSESQRDVNLQKVLPSPGYPTLVLLLAEAMKVWAELVVLDYTSQQVSVRFQVDGQWRDMPPMDRPTGDYMLVSLKQLANLDYRVRDERQAETIQGKLEKHKYKIRIVCEPVPSGERVVLRLELPRPKPSNYIEMGMREKVHERVKQFFKQGSGLIVSATLPGDGASTAWNGLRSSGDRFMADYVTFEAKGRIEDDVINVGSVTYQSPGTFATELQQLLLKEPDAVFFSNVRTPDIMRSIVDVGLASGRLMAVQIEARTAVEALYRLQILGMTPGEISKHLVGVVVQRLARRLCHDCREAFEPDPATLTKLGIQPGRVRELYREFDPAAYTTQDSKGNPIPPPVCPNCGGSGYFGRIGLFEVLSNDDTVKQILKQNLPYAQAVQAWKQAGNPTFREEGIAAVAVGVTGIEELQRVLRS